MNIHLQNGSLRDRLANQCLPRHFTRPRYNSLQMGLNKNPPSPFHDIIDHSSILLFPPTHVLVPVHQGFHFSFSLYTDVPSLVVQHSSSSRFSSHSFHLEVSLLLYEELVESWVPLLDCAPFHPSFGFVSVFLILLLEEIAPTIGKF